MTEKKRTHDKTLLVIAGPTGSGKTDLSIRLARHYGAPIVSCDSRQVYRGMAVGTAQPDAAQLAAVPHHLIACRDVDEDYTCGAFEQDALAVLAHLFADHDVVVAVGGSGLYIDALCHGMDALPQGDPQLRAELNRRLTDHGLETLLDELRVCDPDYFEKVDRGNPQRVVRALEVCRQTGRPYSSFRTGGRAERPFRIVKVGIDLPRAELYARIDRRVDAMMAAGLEREARALYPHRALNALQTVGYRELFACFDGTIPLAEAVELIKRNSRRYAKRQLTWFRRDAQMRWFAPDAVSEIVALVDGK